MKGQTKESRRGSSFSIQPPRRFYCWHEKKKLLASLSINAGWHHEVHCPFLQLPSSHLASVTILSLTLLLRTVFLTMDGSGGGLSPYLLDKRFSNDGTSVSPSLLQRTPLSYNRAVPSPDFNVAKPNRSVLCHMIFH